MKIIYSILFTVLFCSSFSFGQIPVPKNGVEESEASIYVLRNAKIIVSPEKIINKGSLVFENGKITAVGRLVRLPDGAIIIDMEGKTIVPSFIESYSSIGLPEVEGQKWSPKPQIETSKEGAYYWNESIHPEADAALHFKSDSKASKVLQEMGFSVAVTHIEEGIARGNGTVVALGDIPYKNAILKSKGGAYFSLEKGVSKQTYPSSQMGAIALLRQALYDASYYKNNRESLPENLSLNALNEQLSGSDSRLFL